MAAWAHRSFEGSSPETVEAPRPNLFVVRSSDGAEFPLHRDDFRNITTLDELRYNLLSPLLSIPPEFLILMNEEGAPIARDDAVQHLLLLASTPSSSLLLQEAAKSSGDPSPDGSIVLRNSGSGSSGPRKANQQRPSIKRIFVFDRDHLDSDPDEVADALAVTEDLVLGEPPLNPQDPLPSHLSLSQHNLATLHALVDSIHLQIASLALALANLRRVNTNTVNSFAQFFDSAQPSLERYERLLGGWEGAMEAVGKVAVISGLLTRSGAGAGTTASSVGGAPAPHDKQRYLGDYVSREKMLAVRDGCAKVLAELKMRSEALQATLDAVTGATDSVQNELDVTSADLSDLEACTHDAEQGHLRIVELVQAGSEMTDPELLDDCFGELSHADAEHRDRIRFLIERKNAMTRYFLLEMQKISALQSDIASVPAELAALDRDISTRTDNFKHLARLEGLIPAYVATVAEVVRRREYARLLSEQSDDLSLSYRPLADIERSRRSHYRQTHSGKLPWEVRGLAGTAGTPNERVPEMALEVLDKEEGLPEVGPDALDHLASALAQLEESLGGSTGPESPISRARQLVKDLGGGIDEIRDDFARLSRNPPLPRAPEVDPARLAELEEHVRHLEASNEHLSRKLQAERSSWEEHAAKLETRASTAEDALARVEQEAAAANDKIHRLELSRADAESARREAEDRASDESRKRESAERDLANANAAEAELRKQWSALNDSHTLMQSESATLRAEHEQRGTVISEQEANLKAAQQAQQALTLALAEKDELLRDHRADSELDRAVLEKEADGLRRLLSERDDLVEEATAATRQVRDELTRLREKVVTDERDARKVAAEAATAEEELTIARRAATMAEQERTRLRTVACEALRELACFWKHNARLSTDVSELTVLKTDAPSTTPPAYAPMGPALATDPDASSLDSEALHSLLIELSAYDHGAFRRAVLEKAEGLAGGVKKWIKEAKAYRERAHRATASSVDKIAFRNFAKGDLALFLPTRNSAVPVWAAFNVSFPHHFLSASGVIAEQMKTREWIVARVTEMTEKVVDPQDPSTNPYLLPAGTKYFLLETEPWSSKESSRRRRVSTDKSTGDRRTSSKGTRPEILTTNSAVDVGFTGTSTEPMGPTGPRGLASSPPTFRRTVSEGSPLPPNAIEFGRSDFSIPEAEEEEFHGASRTPSPSLEHAQAAKSTGAQPSARLSELSKAIAFSTPSTPALEDPFAAPAQSPFGTPGAGADSSSPHAPTILTDFQPAVASSDTMPAFLPASSARRPSRVSADGSVLSVARGPRYAGPAERASQATGIARVGSGSNPATALLSSSPASTSASSIHVVSQPRSVSSASGILSASIHRRGSSSALGVGAGAPSSHPSVKAAPTQAAQLVGSGWQAISQNTSRDSTASRADPKVSRGWPSGSSPSNGQTSSLSSGPPPAERVPKRTTGSILDVLKGNKSTGPRGAESASAEDEMRKLLGQPPF